MQQNIWWGGEEGGESKVRFKKSRVHDGYCDVMDRMRNAMDVCEINKFDGEDGRGGSS